MPQIGRSTARIGRSTARIGRSRVVHGLSTGITVPIEFSKKTSKFLDCFFSGSAMHSEDLQVRLNQAVSMITAGMKFN